MAASFCKQMLDHRRHMERQKPKRLAIIGAGSSGLITLKFALQFLPDWNVDCFEKSKSITGCWGHPFEGFISTSTKYTTQFACFPQFDASLNPTDPGGEFFRDGEYGAYLESFADHYDLRPAISLECTVHSIMPRESGWTLTTQRRGQLAETKDFDAVFVCTGLAARTKPLTTRIPQLGIAELNRPGGLERIRDKSIVVVGGGESAADYAYRLAAPELGNKVYLSLRSGIRVSPRYHPIRGVPSDFLRNRLMLSVHAGLRNLIGHQFVRARIRYEEIFQRLFPEVGGTPINSRRILRRQKEWSDRLTVTAKAGLFNMFHNKSDDFLQAVGDGRIEIVGPFCEKDETTFFEFDSADSRTIHADMIVPAVGYRSTFEELSGGELKLEDFYLGCLHQHRKDVFLIGFARPIIGNIPSISEMQAHFSVATLAQKIARPNDIERRHLEERRRMRIRYGAIDLNNVYPVEMYQYCDDLAKRLNVFPRPTTPSALLTWIRMQLAPASTLHYIDSPENGSARKARYPIYMPAVLIGLLIMLMPLSALLFVWDRWQAVINRANL